ncbi:GTPase-activating protein BEM2 [Ashbya gossypii ATCC 10895] [Rhizoctonia solani]|uniref:GTPase-activating protein BEM2 [Ashbya gossypii ATCC 10895] n=1 Tax=Rhizoctonia solani TaxID=456999 RepID=A0A0K6G2G1_9AGAM|nr:GTPase-activating protein BEM2 [Ashbya gossypii ATCC 10895] [Rhizoctonia solani]
MSVTSFRSNSRGKSDKAPKSSFAERFGGPVQPQAQGSQTSFPTWPGLQSTQASPYINPLNIRPPLSTPITQEKETREESIDSTIRRSRHPQLGQKPRELFSDRIGNASSFVNTSSLEAKVAMEPAVYTLSRWMVAAKSNIARFKSIPEPVEHNFQPSTSSTNTESAHLPLDSTTRHDTLESSPKPFPRASRSPIVTPSGRRMLCTSTVEVSTSSSLSAVQANHQTTTVDRSSLWRVCAIWMLTAVCEIRPPTQPIVSGFIRQFCVTRHRPFSNPSLSFFQPAFHPSLLVFSRAYATKSKRSYKRQAACRIHKQRRDENRPNPQRPSEKSPVTRETPPDIDAPYILIPAPTTQTELCNALRYLIQSTEPPASLPRLIATHAQYSTLQTSTSYNLLLAHASRVAPIPYSAQIISQLRASGTIWTKRTEQFVVRAHIQSGKWEEAVQLAEKLWVDGAVSRTPLDIFAELLHLVLTKRTTTSEIASMADRCWKLFPTAISVDVINRSPRILYNIVRLLSNLGRHDRALQLVMKLLESLDSPTPSNIRYCRAILFHVIRPPRGRPSAYQFGERRQLFESLLQHNPALKLTPDPGLTWALLQNLRKRRKRGAAAFYTLLELRAKYGPQVEDSTVRRTIARYAIEEENIDLARSMFEREKLARLEDTKQTSLIQPKSEAPWAGQEALPTQSHLEYIRSRGPENRKFTVTARSLRRKERKLGKEGRIHPEDLLAAEKWWRWDPDREQRGDVLFTGDTGNEKKDN